MYDPSGHGRALSLDALGGRFRRRSRFGHGPPVIELSLSNDVNREISVFPREQGGLPLEYVPYLEGENGRLLLYPATPEHVRIINGTLPAGRTDDCWRVPDDLDIAVQSMAFEAVLPAGKTYSIRHRLYHDRPADGCFPPGTYRTTERLALGSRADDAPSFELSYELTVSSSGEVSISVTGPTITP